MKVSVFGAAGLLGSALVEHYQRRGDEVICYTRADVDLSDRAALSRALLIDKSELVYNASGMTGLEGCLDQPELAQRLNVEVPAEMARSCAARGATFVHFSTDYVFEGEENRFLTESDIPKPVNAYGETKWAGEEAVLAVMPSALVCRVSWLFGHGRKSFADQVVQHALSGNCQAYVADKFSVPNFADDLAAMCEQLTEKRAAGVVHLCSDGGEVSWFSYATAVLDVLVELGKLEAAEGLLEKSKLNSIKAFRAKRPRFTSMRSERLREEFGIEPAQWRTGLKRFLAVG